MRLRRSILLSSSIRVVTLPVGAICSITSAALVIEDSGAALFGLVSVIVNLFQLFVFTDLGLGAVVVPLLAGREGEARRPGDLLSLGRVFRLLWAAAGILIALSWTLAALGAWPVLLGTAGVRGVDAELNWTTAVALTVFALSVPLGIGQRILLGLQANHIITLLGVFAPLAALGWTAMVVFAGLPILLAGAGASFGLVVTSLAWMIASQRRLRLPLRVILGIERGAPIAIWALAVPQLVITLLTPIGNQSGRIVLAQASTAGELATYSLVSQLWTPVLSVVYVSTISLWPAFHAAGAEGGRLLMRSWAIVAAASTVIGAAFALLAAPACALISGGQIVPDTTLLVLLAALLVVTSLVQVSTLFLMDASGLRIQVVLVVAALAVNLTISILTTPALGASGPVIGTLVGLLLVQGLPVTAVAYRRARVSGSAG